MPTLSNQPLNGLLNSPVLTTSRNSQYPLNEPLRSLQLTLSNSELNSNVYLSPCHILAAPKNFAASLSSKLRTSFPHAWILDWLTHSNDNLNFSKIHNPPLNSSLSCHNSLPQNESARETAINHPPFLRRIIAWDYLPKHVRETILTSQFPAESIPNLDQLLYLLVAPTVSVSKPQLLESINGVSLISSSNSLVDFLACQNDPTLNPLIHFILPIPVHPPPISQAAAATRSLRYWPSLYNSTHSGFGSRQRSALLASQSIGQFITQDRLVQNIHNLFHLTWQVALGRFTTPGNDKEIHHTGCTGHAIIGCVFVDRGTSHILAATRDGHCFSSQDIIRSPNNPLNHAIMRGINEVSMTLARPSLKLGQPNRSSPYLCHNVDVYVTHEPCVACTMALVHSRITNCIFERPMIWTGALNSGMCLVPPITSHEGSTNFRENFFMANVNAKINVEQCESFTTETTPFPPHQQPRYALFNQGRLNWNFHAWRYVRSPHHIVDDETASIPACFKVHETDKIHV